MANKMYSEDDIEFRELMEIIWRSVRNAMGWFGFTIFLFMVSPYRSDIAREVVKNNVQDCPISNQINQ